MYVQINQIEKIFNKLLSHQIAWAPGKCMKEKQWKDYWDVDIGVSYIPYAKIDQSVRLKS